MFLVYLGRKKGLWCVDRDPLRVWLNGSWILYIFVLSGEVVSP